MSTAAFQSASRASARRPGFFRPDLARIRVSHWTRSALSVLSSHEATTNPPTTPTHPIRTRYHITLPNHASHAPYSIRLPLPFPGTVSRRLRHHMSASCASNRTESSASPRPAFVALEATDIVFGDGDRNLTLSVRQFQSCGSAVAAFS